MTFNDLPKDWPLRSLAEPTLAADVVDLVVRDKDRSEGGLSLLLCRSDGSLAQHVFIETDGCPDLADLVVRMGDIVAHVPEVRGLVVAIAKPFGAVSDADRRVHQAAIDACRDQGLTLHGTYLATTRGVTHLPVTGQFQPVRPGHVA